MVCLFLTGCTHSKKLIQIENHTEECGKNEDGYYSYVFGEIWYYDDGSREVVGGCDDFKDD